MLASLFACRPSSAREIPMLRETISNPQRARVSSHLLDECTCFTAPDILASSKIRRFPHRCLPRCRREELVIDQPSQARQGAESHDCRVGTILIDRSIPSAFLSRLTRFAPGDRLPPARVSWLSPRISGGYTW